VLGYAVYTYWPLVSPYFARPVSKVKLEEVREKAAAPAPLPTPAAEEAKMELVEEKKIVREARELVDPFSLRVSVRSKKEIEAKPGVALKPAPRPEPKLEGIWVDPNLRAAFISGQVMTEGSIIMGWRVDRIFRTEVWLKKGKSLKILRMEGR